MEAAMGDWIFEVTEEHVTLLRHAYVGWEGCEFGAPAINCKRPYGNSDVITDIAKLLHPEFSEMREGAQMDWLEDNAVRLRAVHETTQTALQIFLVTGHMKPGRYIRLVDYDQRSWRPTND
jgi:hypothetical protein